MLGQAGFREGLRTSGNGGLNLKRRKFSALIITLRNASSSRSRETSGRNGKNRSLTTSATMLPVTAFSKLMIKPKFSTSAFPG
jgi:hypothetical protein